MTDTEILDFLQDVTVSTVYMDSGEIIDVAGNDVRAAVVAVASRPRCVKCKCLLEKYQVKDGWCSECWEEEK